MKISENDALRLLQTAVAVERGEVLMNKLQADMEKADQIQARSRQLLADLTGEGTSWKALMQRFKKRTEDSTTSLAA